jgi:hydrogenase/urease accessory protein HupE
MANFFLQGLQHPWQFPAHVMMLIGLGLLLGQQSKPQRRLGWWVFVLAMVMGLGLTQLPALVWNGNVALLALACVSGCLLALRLELPVRFCAVLAGVGGCLIGLDSAPVMIPGMKALKLYSVLAGTALGASLSFGLLILLAALLRTVLDGLILRILGSWVAASALMVLALLFAPHH